ncbi:OmpA family protein [Aliiroseovarius sp. S1339]|uniref:OmpA family protein n=1 Tax=Aliiroseovarius sp. S1339 TaxID=2936990 RepID=UPI0020BFE26D|nr:OmpA family protein [Aliiroseovarius sp. S1339]MCK8464539.1 OmpA family protein [Aliiroseovarius sp. S1339]
MSRLFRLGFLVMSCAFATSPAYALDLPAGAKLRASDKQDAARANLAVARFDGETVPTIAAEGQVNRQAWKVNGTSQTSFQILVSLRDQLVADGYEILLQCQTVSCGGYDFRFEVGHFKAPDMYVDLGDFHYLSARKGDQFAGLLVSRSKEDAFVELVQVSPAGSTNTKVSAPQTTSTTTVRVQPSGPIGKQLETSGRTVLSGLSFATGSSQLTDEDVPVLAELAKYLAQNPARQIILVGHTDAEGSLDGNVALSRKRATSVMNSLIKLYGANPAQLSAQGVGFLMPLAANLTPQGRELNRRVEAVLTSTE